MAWKVKETNGNGVVCSLCPIPVVYLEPMVKQKLEDLMGAYPHQEWSGYMVGKMSDKGNIFVEDLVIPPHAYAEGASAEVLKPDYDAKTGKYDFHIPPGCIGFIHSHHSMGAFHSGTDQGHVDKNYPVSITVAKRDGQASMEFATVCYSKTPCGKTMTGVSQVKYVAPKPLYDTKTWLEEAKANIDRGKKVEKMDWPASSPTSVQPNLPYIPYRYRSGSLLEQEYDAIRKGLARNGSSDDVITGEDGVVLTKKELQDMLDAGA